MQKKMNFVGAYLIFAIVFGSLCLFSTMQVSARSIPVAVPNPPDQTIYAGDEAYFEGYQSYSIGGYIESYSWDFGDGNNSTDINTSHVYITPGDYIVNLEVTDNQTEKANKSVNVTVLEVPEGNTTASIESLTSDEEEYDMDEAINASVVIEKDDGGTPSMWEGTLLFEVLDDTLDVVHYDERDIIIPEVMDADTSYFDFNLSEPGDHLIRAKLYDNATVLVDQKEITVSIIKEIQNQLPVAVIKSDHETVNVTELVWFFGNLSYDPDGSIVSYDWDFGDENSSDEMIASHFYDLPGDYVIKLTVKDDSDAENTTKITLNVVEPENEPPVAVIRSEVSKIEAGKEIWFYGNQSYDRDGIIASFQWDLGDGNYTSGTNTSHVYNSPGNYTITLTILDDANSESGDSVIVEVVEPEGGIPDEVQIKPGNAVLGNIILFGGLGTLSFFILMFLTEAGKYRFLLLLIPLYTKLKKDEILDHFTRGKINGYIMANPGDHFNSIKKALRLSDGSFAHHIRILEKEGIIKSTRDGTHRRFYPAEMPIPENGSTLKKSQLLIIEKIKEAPGISQKDIATLLGVSSPTVNYHLKELLKREIIRGERAGMRMKYYVNPEKAVNDAMPEGKITEA
jgi:predicted transcriptional regulator/PKD repeat protein